MTRTELREKLKGILYGDFFEETVTDTEDLDQILHLIDEYVAGVIGEDWPKHCDKGFDNCNQCRNREIRNSLIYEQRRRAGIGEK